VRVAVIPINGHLCAETARPLAGRVPAHDGACVRQPDQRGRHSALSTNHGGIIADESDEPGVPPSQRRGAAVAVTRVSRDTPAASDRTDGRTASERATTMSRRRHHLRCVVSALNDRYVRRRES
jgi:hypothetical protein